MAVCQYKHSWESTDYMEKICMKCGENRTEGELGVQEWINDEDDAAEDDKPQPMPKASDPEAALSCMFWAFGDGEGAVSWWDFRFPTLLDLALKEHIQLQKFRLSKHEKSFF